MPDQWGFHDLGPNGLASRAGNGTPVNNGVLPLLETHHSRNINICTDSHLHNGADL